MSGTDRDPSPPITASGLAPAAELLHEQQQQQPEDEAPLEPPMPPFEPLFALLTNSTTNTTVHPRIHYLFSDDDPSVLASPAVDRALVVDLVPAPEGDSSRWAVSWAASLTPDFAVTTSNVAVQQSEGDDDGRNGGALMLRVEGVEREPVEMRPDSLPSSGSGAIGGEDVDVLAEDFRRRMGVLKKVVDEGEKRRALVGQEHEDEQVDEDEGPPDEAIVDYDSVEKGKEKAKE
ncbi:uncharacterized protein NECHADRAFT_98909 [Fusarium vanettenii 77-13-4]|uniref:Uncharacterized protein n=1 Tax=Fusarium vanettenii (strain ATCC MYA-4622 / CBS 123669 / FGSC 9596 / NRRL 45880 / 77-13-4) TaxID=660122 RepID=C7YI41_FUSV7|nr:uncharacterized protein NECHADRAFT_98909 [Fusarium vanettenii 77-13-4]EEU48741.1 hypothetical protein NECHADRAFT_98909 [Fusarium vanettenii 77-13-4]